MRHTTTIYVIALILFPVIANAKRIPAPKVEPVIYRGIQYVVPNDNGRRGYIQALETGTDRMLWSLTIFRNFIKPFREEDVQWVYIKTLRIEDGKLLVIDERNRAYSVDLKTRTVRRLRKSPPETPRSNRISAQDHSPVLNAVV